MGACGANRTRARARMDIQMGASGASLVGASGTAPVQVALQGSFVEIVDRFTTLSYPDSGCRWNMYKCRVICV